jgi:hypothetical protein
MIRCIKLWTGADQKSHFEEGFIDLEPGARGDALSGKLPITSASFHETDVDPKLGWHPDTDRQLVITLSGTLEFETPDGRFTLRPGDILFTEDTDGAGHNWKMIGAGPGAVSTQFSIPTPSFPFGQPFLEGRTARVMQQRRQEQPDDPMCTSMDRR